MPKPVRSPSPFLGEMPNLSSKVQAELVAVIEPTDPPTSLAQLPHCVSVLAEAIRAIGRRIPGNSPTLCNLISRLDAIRLLLPPENDPSTQVPAGADFSLWSVLCVVDTATATARLYELIGAAYCSMAFQGERVSRPQLELLVKVASLLRAGLPCIPEMAALEVSARSTWTKVQVYLQPRARSRTSAASDVIEARIEHRWINAKSFENPTRLDDVKSTRALDKEDIRRACSFIRRMAEEGDPLAILNSLSIWIGISPAELQRVSLFSEQGTGLLRMVPTCGCLEIDLSGVLGDLAAPTGDERVQKTSDLLRFRMPSWLADIVRALRAANPSAATLADLGLEIGRTERRLASRGQAPASRITIGRVIACRGCVLSADDVNQHVAAYATLDFARAGKSAYPYERITLDELVSALRVRAQAMDWGALAHDENHDARQGIGSRVTPMLHAIVQLAEERLKLVRQSVPGPNAGWDRLVVHHNHFVLQVLLLAALGWLLRGQVNIQVSAAFLSTFECPGWTDKKLPKGSGAVAPLACGQTLRRQLEWLRMQYLALANRAERLASRDGAELASVAKSLRDAAAGNPSLPLLLFIEGKTVRAACVADLGWCLPDGWEFKRDALRHLGADELRGQGLPAEIIEDLLRHIVNCSELFSASAGISVHEWRENADHAQDKLFRSLGLQPVSGLVRGLQ